MKDSKAKIAGAVIAILGFGFFTFVAAAGIWSLTTGDNCGTSGEGKCIDTDTTAGTDYVNIYYRDVDGTRFCEKTVSSARDFNPYASPYAMVGDCGLGDWPTVDFQVVINATANACDGLDIEDCMAADGSEVGICASYPGGVYAAFTIQDCIEGASTPPTGGTITYEDDLGTLIMLYLWTMMMVLGLVLLTVPILIIGFRNVFKGLR